MQVTSETKLQKYIRVGFGGAIITASTYFYALNNPEHPTFPVWALLSGWIFGAGLAFSTVVRGLVTDLANVARKTIPFLDRRVVGRVDNSLKSTGEVKSIPTTVTFEKQAPPNRIGE